MLSWALAITRCESDFSSYGQLTHKLNGANTRSCVREYLGVVEAFMSEALLGRLRSTMLWCRESTLLVFGCMLDTLSKYVLSRHRSIFPE